MLERVALAIAALFAAVPASAQTAAPLLHSIFQDHGVLQRGRPIPVWGRAAPGETVTISLGDVRAEARAGPNGDWLIALRAFPAGGPYTLTVTAGSRTQIVQDLLVGDVWLCSGQSNMEWGVAGALHGAAEVSSANDPETRILTVEHDVALTPQEEFLRPVKWQAVTPQTIGDFSAVCWFAARELRRTQKVPFGLIDSSWGGSAINAWRSEASMADDPAVREQLALLALYQKDPVRAGTGWGRFWGDWWRERTGEAAGAEPWISGADDGWKPIPVAEALPWEQWGVPDLANYNGILWYEIEVALTAAQAAKPATLTFGVVDDLDVTWINGAGVGSTASWDKGRSYRLAPRALRAGKNRIVLAAFDSYSFGGLTGKAEERAIRFGDGTSVPLPPVDKWRYRVSPGIMDQPRAPWETTAGLAGMYNAMIAPFGPYGLTGAMWYQGESDGGTPDGYAGRLAGLMAGWRSQFGNAELPFVIVQLPQWGAFVTKPAESGFASIRDEQRRAVLADAHAGLVVTIDVGDPADLHPVNKQPVGQRAARAARALAYGAAEKPSGPIPMQATRSGASVTVRFGGFDGALVTYSSAQPIGFELCGPAKDSCRFVPAQIDGSNVVLEAGGGPADRVRYCWGDSPVCNLYDAGGLPASPGELKVE